MRILIIALLLTTACVHQKSVTYQDPYTPLTAEQQRENASIQTEPSPPSNVEPGHNKFMKALGQLFQGVGKGMQQQPATTNCNSQIIGNQIYTHCR